MSERIIRPILFGAYQLTLLLGVIFLPLAVAFGRLGVTLPFHRLVESISSAYERSTEIR